MKGALIKPYLACFLSAAALSFNGVAADWEVRNSWPNLQSRQRSGVAVSGRIAYVAAGQAGVEVIDFREIGRPQLITEMYLGGRARDVVAKGGFLYVADEYSGLHILDISKPGKVKRIGGAPVDGPASFINVMNNHVYISARHAGVQIFNVTNPAKPIRVSRVTLGESLGRVAVSPANSRVLVLDGQALQAIDVTNPTSPQLLPPYRTNVNFGIVASAPRFVVLGTRQGLEFIDALDPYAPNSPPRHFTFPGSTARLNIVDDRVFANDIYAGDQIFNIPEAPDAPSLIGGWPEGAGIFDLEESEGYLFGLSFDGIKAFDKVNPESPRLISTYTGPLGGFINGRIIGNVAYLNSSGVFATIDLSDPNNLRQLGSINHGINSDFEQIAFSKTCAYLPKYNGDVTIIDFSDPESPRVAGKISLPPGWRTIAASQDRLYISYYDRGGSGLHIFDIRDGANPILIGATTNFWADKMAPAGDYLYLLHGDFLNVADVRDPKNPTLLGPGVPTAANYITLIAEKYIYLTDFNQEWQIIDFSIPTNPKIVRTGPKQVYNMTVVNTTAYLSVLAGTQVHDISDPANPTQIFQSAMEGMVLGSQNGFTYLLDGSLKRLEIAETMPERIYGIEAPGLTNRLKVVDRFAYVAGNSALSIYDISEAGNPKNTVSILGHARAAAVGSDFLCIAGDTGLRVVDSASKQITATLPGPFADVEIAGEFAFATTTTGPELVVINCSNRFSPFIENRLPIGSSEIEISGEYLFSPDKPLRIYDISDPKNTRQIAQMTTDFFSSRDLAVKWPYVFTVHSAGISAINISDPKHPWMIGDIYEIRFGTGFFKEIAIAGNHAYVADQFGSLLIYDISNPSRLVRARATAAFNSADLAASNDTLYVLDMTNGLQVMDLFRPNPRTLQLTALSPLRNGEMRLRVNGPVGASVRIDRMKNGAWAPWRPYTVGPVASDVIDPDATESMQFYRMQVE